MDLDGVEDRYDADFRDNKVQEIGDFKNKEKESIMDKLKGYKERISEGSYKNNTLEFCKEDR